MSEQPTVAEQLWSQLVTDPAPLDRDGEGELTGEGYRQLHERARWASSLLVDLICGEETGVAVTFAVMSGFAWTAAPCVPLLNAQRKTERQGQIVQRVVEAITAGEGKAP